MVNAVKTIETPEPVPQARRFISLNILANPPKDGKIRIRSEYPLGVPEAVIDLVPTYDVDEDVENVLSMISCLRNRSSANLAFWIDGEEYGAQHTRDALRSTVTIKLEQERLACLQREVRAGRS